MREVRKNSKGAAAAGKQMTSASEAEQKEEELDSVDLKDDEAVRRAGLASASASVRFYVWMYKTLTNPLLS